MLTCYIPQELKKNGLYPIAKASTLLGISRTALYAMIKDKRIKTQLRRADNRTVISGAEIERIITEKF